MMKQRLPITRIANRGTCPTCGGKYAITDKGVLRRHIGKVDPGKCHSNRQLPVEIIPAILEIARLEVLE